MTRLGDHSLSDPSLESPPESDDAHPTLPQHLFVTRRRREAAQHECKILLPDEPGFAKDLEGQCASV